MGSTNDPSGIVAVGAHAADMELAAGATVLRHVRDGWQAHLVHLTLGEKGHRVLSPAEYGAQKRREAEESAAILGATPHFLAYRDGELRTDESTATALAAVLRRLRPSVVITHPAESIHRDHSFTHHLTRRAIFLACIRHFDLDGLPPAPYPRVYYADNWEDARDFQPFVYVDVSAEMPDWERAVKAFAIGRGEGGFPYWDWYAARTRLHGIAIGVAHAQAFAVEPEGMRVVRSTL